MKKNLKKLATTLALTGLCYFGLPVIKKEVGLEDRIKKSTQISETFSYGVKQAFADSVKLGWKPPTEYTNHTLLEDGLDNFKIYYDQNSGYYNRSYANQQSVAGSETSYTLSGLADGRWFFAVTAIKGAESDYSNEISIELGLPKINLQGVVNNTDPIEVGLKWSKMTSPQPSLYIVSRSMDPSGPRGDFQVVNQADCATDFCEETYSNLTPDELNFFHVTAHGDPALEKKGESNIISLAASVNPDTEPPTFDINSYAGQDFNLKPSISGYFQDNSGNIESVLVNGQEATINMTKWTSQNLDLTNGLNRIHVQVTDYYGNTSEQYIWVDVDNTPPKVSINYPQYTDEYAVLLEGVINEDFSDLGWIQLYKEKNSSIDKLYLNKNMNPTQPYVLSEYLSALDEGKNDFKLIAYNSSNLKTEKEFSVIKDTTKPVADLEFLVQDGNPQLNLFWDDDTPVTINALFNDEIVQDFVEYGSSGSRIIQIDKSNLLTDNNVFVSYIDKLSNETIKELNFQMPTGIISVTNIDFDLKNVSPDDWENVGNSNSYMKLSGDNVDEPKIFNMKGQEENKTVFDISIGSIDITNKYLEMILENNKSIKNLGVYIHSKNTGYWYKTNLNLPVGQKEYFIPIDTMSFGPFQNRTEYNNPNNYNTAIIDEIRFSVDSTPIDDSNIIIKKLVIGE